MSIWIKFLKISFLGKKTPAVQTGERGDEEGSLDPEPS